MAKATTNISFSANLSANQEVFTGTYSPQDPSHNLAGGTVEPDFVRAITIYDAAGQGHDVNIGFKKIADSQWSTEIYCQKLTDAVIPGRVDGLIAASNISFAPGSLSIDAALKKIPVIEWTDGSVSKDINIKLDLYQHQQPYAVYNFQQNGEPRNYNHGRGNPALVYGGETYDERIDLTAVMNTANVYNESKIGTIKDDTKSLVIINDRPSSSKKIANALAPDSLVVDMALDPKNTQYDVLKVNNDLVVRIQAVKGSGFEPYENDVLGSKSFVFKNQFLPNNDTGIEIIQIQNAENPINFRVKDSNIEVIRANFKSAVEQLGGAMVPSHDSAMVTPEARALAQKSFEPAESASITPQEIERANNIAKGLKKVTELA